MSEPSVLMEFAAVADADDHVAIKDVERIVHDRLLAAAGPTRRTGVMWTEYAADSESARSWLAEHIGAEATGLLSFLRENPRGALVVGSCEVAT